MQGSKNNDAVCFAVIKVALGALATAYLVFDIWQVGTGQVDLNRHLPFFMPTVLSAFVFITLAIQKHGARVPEKKP